ncbi:hypothetical protein M758_7G170000 [Ceratodon purpureus]|nr:hypothetical protein M758_7G170000 [Ceratodon purpureus]
MRGTHAAGVRVSPPTGSSSLTDPPGRPFMVHYTMHTFHAPCTSRLILTHSRMHAVLPHAPRLHPCIDHSLHLKHFRLHHLVDWLIIEKTKPKRSKLRWP